MAQAPTRRSVARYIAERLVDGDDQADMMQQLAAYLIAKRKTKQLARYIDDIEIELAAHGVVIADVTTARPLGDDLRASVESLIAKQTGSRHVALREHVDADLIGGMVIRSAGYEYDRSIKCAVRALRSV